jgi:hypothetical protein
MDGWMIHIFLHHPMDDHHFGHKQKSPLKKTHLDKAKKAHFPAYGNPVDE